MEVEHLKTVKHRNSRGNGCRRNIAQHASNQTPPKVTVPKPMPEPNHSYFARRYTLDHPDALLRDKDIDMKGVHFNEAMKDTCEIVPYSRIYGEYPRTFVFSTHGMILLDPKHVISQVCHSGKWLQAGERSHGLIDGLAMRTETQCFSMSVPISSFILQLQHMEIEEPVVCGRLAIVKLLLLRPMDSKATVQLGFMLDRRIAHLNILQICFLPL